jgi:hypothetical protein
MDELGRAGEMLPERQQRRKEMTGGSRIGAVANVLIDLLPVSWYPGLVVSTRYTCTTAKTRYPKLL